MATLRNAPQRSAMFRKGSAQGCKAKQRRSFDSIGKGRAKRRAAMELLDSARPSTAMARPNTDLQRHCFGTNGKGEGQCRYGAASPITARQRQRQHGTAQQGKGYEEQGNATVKCIPQKKKGISIMKIPDCYDPIYQAERRESRWDKYAKTFRRCDLCGCLIHPGDKYRECYSGSVCADCFEELSKFELIEGGE